MKSLQYYEKNNKNHRGEKIIPGICLHENLIFSKLTKNVFNCFTINFTTDSYHDVILHHDSTLYSEDYVRYETLYWFSAFMYGGEHDFWYVWEGIQVDNISYNDLNDDLIYNFKKHKKMRVKVFKGSNFAENKFLCDDNNSNSFDTVSSLNTLNCSNISI